MTLPEHEIRNRFAYHPATKQTAAMHDAVREAFLELALAINEQLPQSRETSACLTSIQEAMMWANASIACNLAPLATPEQQATPQPTHGQGETILCGAAAATGKGQAFLCTRVRDHEGLHSNPLADDGEC